MIKESLRIYPGIPSPLPRVLPTAGSTLDGKLIPGGVSQALFSVAKLTIPQTIVGISSVFVHMDEDIFPDPDEFCPERWLERDGKALDKWMLAFSRGPRSCVGIKYVSRVASNNANNVQKLSLG